MGSFTPLVFGTNGGTGKECQLFLSNLARTASLMTVPYLGLEHAYLLKFYDQSTNVLEGLEPFSQEC